MTRAACLTLGIVAAALHFAAGLAGTSSVAAEPVPFAGTQPLTMEGDLAEQLVAGVDRFLLKELAQSVKLREQHFKRDFSSPEAYEQSLAPNRERLAKILGVVEPRIAIGGLSYISTTARDSLVAQTDAFSAHAVSWPAFGNVTGRGLLLVPKNGPAGASVIAIPDADQTPEMLAGLEPGLPTEQQFARRLAEGGCRVIIPFLIDRADTYSVTRAGRATNQPHREFLYRPAFEVGRHVIGMELQKVLAVVDWLERDAAASGAASARIGVYGYGEGGLLALYAGALDTRIDCVATSGYFQPRENLWEEPIYRNVFGLLEQFGDAELAAMIAPRALLIEASAAPAIHGPPTARDGRSGAAPGLIRTPELAAVESELARARDLVKGLGKPGWATLVKSGDGTGPGGCTAALTAFAQSLGLKQEVGKETSATIEPLWLPDYQEVLKSQMEEMTQHVEDVLDYCEYERVAYWSKADRGSRSVEKWLATVGPYKEAFKHEVIGHFDLPLLPPNARSRQIYDEPSYTGYEVVLDVFPDVFAYGILLMPKNIKAGEKRPVVVCQHGLEGRPTDVADPKNDNPAYHQFANRLAEQGFITFAPQNLYIFTDKFRTLQRKGNPLKKTLFSVIVPQHQQIVSWLGSLPMVDAERIGFYGLSYGGKSAMRIPALVDGYCLSICSADFNEWVRKNASIRAPFSYVGTGEYEIFEWDLGHTFNYAEMAALIAPRPFMVERGHRDGVGVDEWVSFEFAKVKLLYVDLKIGERAEIEFFDGPHTINGQGTYAFLRKHLNFPPPAQR